MRDQAERRRIAVEYLKATRKLNLGNEVVILNTRQKAHEITFLRFVTAWHAKTIDLIFKGEMPHDPVAFLLRYHKDQVLNAINQGEPVPTNVLMYRLKSEFFKPIKQYCRTKNIDLDQ